MRTYALAGRASLAFGVSLSALAPACSSPPIESQRLPLEDDPSDREGSPGAGELGDPEQGVLGGDEDAGAVVLDGSAVPPSPTMTRFYGSLPATSPVSFGGAGGVCAYEITFRNVTVDVRQGASGQITTAVVKARMEEVDVPKGSCATPVIPPNAQTFTFVSAAKGSGDSVVVKLAGASTNAPRADLVMEVSPQAPAATAKLAWKRTDGAAQTSWTVPATIPLEPRLCTPSTTYCGGVDVPGTTGTLYLCTADGKGVTPTQVCLNGCEVVPGKEDRCKP